MTTLTRYTYPVILCTRANDEKMIIIGENACPEKKKLAHDRATWKDKWMLVDVGGREGRATWKEVGIQCSLLE